MRVVILGTGLAVLVLAGAVHGQPYTIKLKDQPEVDKPVVFRELNKQTTRVRLFDGQGQLLHDRTEPATTETVYTLTVLKPGQQRPTKYHRKYELATRSDGKKTETLPHQGRGILYELRVGQYLLTVDGKDDLPRDDFKALVNAANADVNTTNPSAIFLPPRPVRVGESWTVEPRLLTEVFSKDGVVEEAKSSGKATLVKAAEKDGHLHGLIEVDVRVAYKSMAGLTYDPPAVLEVKSKLETALDGSSPVGVLQISGKLSGRGRLDTPNQKGLLELSMEFNGRHERTESKDKRSEK
jgi:hypothetical protein